METKEANTEKGEVQCEEVPCARRKYHCGTTLMEQCSFFLQKLTPTELSAWHSPHMHFL